MGPNATLVAFSNQDAWIAQVSGFNLDKVESVTYFVRDSANHWHSVGPVTDAPFTAELDWWTWENAGQMVVTSHVQMQAGGDPVKDPGGWTTIDGQGVNPGGHLETLANSDGSLGARYTPDHGVTHIAAVQFWLRVSGQWSQVAQVSQPSAAGSFEVMSISGTRSDGWKSDDVAAMSVHVVWAGGQQWVDPAPWAWRDHFTAATAPPSTPTATPTAAPATPPPPSAPPPTAPPATVAPPTAPPAQAPAPPAGCYPLTNSGGCYEPGEFCRTSDHGRTGLAGDGEAIVCVNNDGWRWERA
jgi:hypothetical protein